MSYADIHIYNLMIEDGIDSDSAVCAAARVYAADFGLDLPSDLGFSRASSGKPFFAAIPDLHFSLSHSGAYWLIAFAAQNLGLDIQKHENCHMQALARRFFHEEEYEWLEREGYGEFFSIWTAKESYVKYVGQGIDENFGNFSVVEKNGITKALHGTQLRFLPFEPGYTVCLCALDTSCVCLDKFSQKPLKMV